MLTAYERRLLAFYLANAAAYFRPGDQEASDLADWVASRNHPGACGSNRRRLRERQSDSDIEEGTWAPRRTGAGGRAGARPRGRPSGGLRPSAGLDRRRENRRQAMDGMVAIGTQPTSPTSRGISMFRITVVLVALTIMTTTSTALAIDCLSYLAADTALEKANNDAYAAHRKTVQAAEGAWQEALEHREAAWLEAGKAASAALSDADASYQSALESANRDFRTAKADADASRKFAVAQAWTALGNTVDKARTEIIGPAQTTAFRNSWSTYRQATDTVFETLAEVPEYLAIVKEFMEARVTLEDAMSKVPAETKNRYNEIRIDAEIEHNKTLIAIYQSQRASYTAATSRHQEALASIRKPSGSGAVHVKAGRDAYVAYWQTIHDAYFSYKNVVNPAESVLSTAEARAEDEWKQAYINIYLNPNIGLQRNASGETSEELFASAEAERRLCPY